MNNKKWIIDNFGLEAFKLSDRFADLLLEWSKVHSLTRANSKEEIYKNIVDSIYPLQFVSSFENFADIGTGAGFPGLLLAIARPEAKAYLIEPKAKRVAFLNFVKNTLHLSNVEVVHARVENFSPRSLDLITSRAVADVNLLFSLTAHLKSHETEYLLYKGSSVQSEISDTLNLKNYKIYNAGDRNYLYIKREGLF